MTAFERVWRAALFPDLPVPDLAPLSAADPAAVDALLDAAFGADRHARTAYKLRAGTGVIPGLSIAAFDGGALVGTLQSWPLELVADDSGTIAPLVLVGPVAVRPDRQRDGIGRQLMGDLIARADGEDTPPLALIGDPEYYGRFGFSVAPTGRWRLPGPVERRRLLARVALGVALPEAGLLRARLTFAQEVPA